MVSSSFPRPPAPSTAGARPPARRLGVVVAMAVLAAACTSGDDTADAGEAPARLRSVAVDPADAEPGRVLGDSTGSTIADTTHLGDYTIVDEDFGTEVTVTVDGGVRTIRSNALPNHTTGQFPNEGNPNAVAAQELVVAYPTVPEFTGSATEADVPGVGINGVPFEPGTAEEVTCASGQVLRIEALQDRYDLGLDLNNGHVQPDGTYHYHGPSPLLTAAVGGEPGEDPSDDDLVHIGFAADGHLIYVSRSESHRPSWHLAPGPRVGIDCSYRDQPVEIDGTVPDGTYRSDWVFDADLGDLDRCNGLTVDGEYLYLLTADYPYVPRCLNGAFTPTEAPDGPGVDAGGGNGGN